MGSVQKKGLTFVSPFLLAPAAGRPSGNVSDPATQPDSYAVLAVCLDSAEAGVFQSSALKVLAARVIAGFPANGDPASAFAGVLTLARAVSRLAAAVTFAGIESRHTGPSRASRHWQSLAQSQTGRPRWRPAPGLSLFCLHPYFPPTDYDVSSAAYPLPPRNGRLLASLMEWTSSTSRTGATGQGARISPQFVVKRARASSTRLPRRYFSARGRRCGLC